MRKDVIIFLVLGFLFLIIGKDEEYRIYGVVACWGLAAFIWLKDFWWKRINQRRIQREIENIHNNTVSWFKEFEEFKERELDIADRIDADMWKIQFQELNRRLPNSNETLQWLEWFKAYKKTYGTKPSEDELRNVIHSFM